MKAWSFHEIATGQGFSLPAQLVAVGHEIQTLRSYCWNNARHNHRPFHVLQYTLAGEGRFSWKPEPPPSAAGASSPAHESTGFLGRDVGPGQLFIASPDIGFEYRHPGFGSWEIIWVILEGEAVDRAVSRLRGIRGSPLLELAADSPLVRSIEQLLLRQNAGMNTDAWGLSMMAWEIVTQLLRLGDGAESGAADAVVRSARRWISRNPGGASAAALARHFGYNEKYFAAFFRRHAGLTPARFILRHRMEIARVLLVTTRKPIALIAAELGFSEDNHFSRVFRQLHGISPSQYRNQHGTSLIVDEITTI